MSPSLPVLSGSRMPWAAPSVNEFEGVALSELGIKQLGAVGVLRIRRVPFVLAEGWNVGVWENQCAMIPYPIWLALLRRQGA